MSQISINFFKSKRGFTLLEVLFSLGILAFTICGLLVTYTSSMVLLATAKNANIATNAAMGLMEQIHTDTFSRIANDYDGMVFTVNGMPSINGRPSSSGFVYVNDTNPELLNVTISICWRQGNRVIGEDADLDGTLNNTEDVNGNGIADSPVELESLIANR